MPKSRSVRRIGQLAQVRTGQPIIDRAQDQVVRKLNQLADAPLAGAIPMTVTLGVGLNKVLHGTGQPIRRFLWSAEAEGVVYSRQAENPTPDRTFWVHSTAAAPMRAFLLLLPTL